MSSSDWIFTGGVLGDVVLDARRASGVRDHHRSLERFHPLDFQVFLDFQVPLDFPLDLLPGLPRTSYWVAARSKAIGKLSNHLA